MNFDHGLNKAISTIREALGDSVESPRFVETVARRCPAPGSCFRRSHSRWRTTETIARSLCLEAIRLRLSSGGDGLLVVDFLLAEPILT